jgi:hypothetical protein
LPHWIEPFGLMRDELRPDVEDAELLDALTGTEVALVAGQKSLKSHAAQTAFVTAALLMARTGHTVYLAAPNVPLLGPQPPLMGDRLLDGLLDVGRDLVPGIEYQAATPEHEIDAVVFFDDTEWTGRARSVAHAGAGEWQGWIYPVERACLWPTNGWPIGALATADLIAAEAFKISMRRLRRFALHVDTFDMLFAPAASGSLTLAPDGTPRPSDFGTFDLISGGAIVQAALFSLSRVPDGAGHGRLIEPDISEMSNLNRNAFLLRSRLGLPKAQDLAEQLRGSVKITAIQARYEGPSTLQLQPVVLVGVDHIPTRWAAQRSRPDWLGVGATSHFMAMSSFHASYLPCAGCLHPKDDPGSDPIPTVACVSFAAGLIMASQYLLKLTKVEVAYSEQQVIFRPLRPERLWRSPVASRGDCPVNCQASLKGSYG